MKSEKAATEAREISDMIIEFNKELAKLHKEAFPAKVYRPTKGGPDLADLGFGERADAAVAPGLSSDDHESRALAWRKPVQEFRRDR